MIKKILIFLILLFICQQLKSTAYYVSTSGSDSNGGTSYSPWQSLAYATSQATTAGDIIYVKNGTYYETLGSYLAAGVQIRGEGLGTVITTTTLSTPIIYLQSSISTVNTQIYNLKIDGGGIAHSGIYISNRSNVLISNCMLTNFTTCIELRNTCVYAIYAENISDVEIHHSTIEGTINLFYAENIDIHHNIIGYSTMNINYKDGVYACDVDNFIVRNNYFKNLATQICISSYSNTKIRNVFIYNNVMFNIGVASDEWYGSGIEFGGLTSEPATNIMIANNTMIANPADRNTRIGIYLPCVGYATDIYIQNNIMSGFRYATIFAAGPEPIIDAIYIENNIFWDNTSDSTKTYCMSDSVYYTNIVKPLNQTYDGNLFIDPLFVSEGDFHLSNISPAIAGGIQISMITTDYDDKIRNTTFDIGAYMYGSSTDIDNPDAQMKFLVYPIPFRDQFTFVVDSPEFTNLLMDIYNINGTLIQKNKIVEPISTIYLRNALSGIYFVKISKPNGEILSVVKVVKQ